ncbi:hypothetical protein WR25_25075 [Diploscapter pachys]|uniref:Rab-GAP TBC domain-containing protein n=1 Tax=Diploscapter pachys TaxID=2018661 RepID=A0A2A2KRN5_9BILA|nr:hypothetical protein WR25_25075 [Diploscapter pachys]
MSTNGVPRVIPVQPVQATARRSHSFQKQSSIEREYPAEMRRTSHSIAPLSSSSVLSTGPFKRVDDHRRQHIYEELPFEANQNQIRLPPNHRESFGNSEQSRDRERHRQQSQMYEDYIVEERRRREDEDRFSKRYYKMSNLSKRRGSSVPNSPRSKSPISPNSPAPSVSSQFRELSVPFSSAAFTIKHASLKVKKHLLTYRFSDPLKRAEAHIRDIKDSISNIPKLLDHLEDKDEDAATSSDDPEYEELMERDRIVNLYEKGPENKDIDAWENPDFDIYYKLDRFGFVHKENENLTEEQKEHRKRVQIELSREKKWLRMIEQWQSGHPPSKLEERIWKGIPEKLRMMVWPKLLGADRLMRENQDVYHQLLLRARLVSKDIKQIDLDINRTYRDHLAFRKRYDIKQKSLLNVLAAYSMYNTEVGYCQGMSQIAALLLMYLDEEESFWCMHALMVSPRHSMHGFFVPGFPKLTRFETHFKKVLKKYKKGVYKHLEKHDIPYIYLTKWWFGCFLDRVPFSLALRLWDVFLLEGDSILIAMALNIMKMHERTIKTLGIENFMEFVQTTLPNNFRYTDDQTMHSLQEALSKMRSDRLHKPPPPSSDDLSELPTKALGPILFRPLATIKDEISEIQSRKSKSRPNSAYPSPYPTRRKESAKLKSGGSRPNLNRNESPSRMHSSQTTSAYGSISGLPSQVSHHANPMSTSLDVSTFSYAYSPNALPPNSTKTQQQQQQMVSSRFSIRDEQTGRMVTLVRASPSEDDSPSSFSSEMARIIHDRDNVTRIEL